MEKTVTFKTINNQQGSRTYRLVKHATHSAILIVAQNGESLQNEWGGYSTLHVGKTDYINRKWKAI